MSQPAKLGIVRSNNATLLLLFAVGNNIGMRREPMPLQFKFDDDFRARFRELISCRRDVRAFLSSTLPNGLLEDLIRLSCLAPSVGLSEPWRFVQVSSRDTRDAIREEFGRANSEALGGYSGEQAALYARLKLAGLDQAPVHLAVFADRGTSKGSGLGRRTMPEMVEYSVVAAITTLWLAARAHGVGVGWISIIDPVRVSTILAAEEGWHLVAYLCIGYPEEESLIPELERAGWEKRVPADLRLFQR